MIPVHYEERNCKIGGNSVWYSRAEGEYPRKDKLGRESGLVGETVVPPTR